MNDSPKLLISYKGQKRAGTLMEVEVEIKQPSAWTWTGCCSIHKWKNTNLCLLVGQVK